MDLSDSSSCCIVYSDSEASEDDQVDFDECSNEGQGKVASYTVISPVELFETQVRPASQPILQPGMLSKSLCCFMYVALCLTPEDSIRDEKHLVTWL